MSHILICSHRHVFIVLGYGRLILDLTKNVHDEGHNLYEKRVNKL